MKRLVLVPCIVVASYVAVASYIAWYVVSGLTRSHVELRIPITVSTNRGDLPKDSSSPTRRTSSVHPSYEVPNEPVAITEKSVADSPQTSHVHESIWVTVLLPARVHAGPSVDTPVSQFYPVGTPLRATRYQNDWFEISESGSSPSGWIYRKYLGAISNSERGKVASQEAHEGKPAARPGSVKRYARALPVKRYAHAVPVKRYANAVRSSKRSMQVKQVARGGRTEMASLLQRAFSGY
jgi:hypothetical protein